MTQRPTPQIDALRALYSTQPVPLHHQLAGVADGAERLATGTRSWRTFAPKPAQLDEAIAAADGLARSLRELRTTMHRDSEQVTG